MEGNIGEAEDIPSGEIQLHVPSDGLNGSFASTSNLDVANEFEDVDQIQNTLDEPVMETIMRDVRSIVQKFYHVLLPHNDKKLLRDWDLWGPLAITMALAIMLRESAKDGQQIQVFTGVFVITWFGASVVTMNAKLLGCNLSFFQCLCVLGYCMVPLLVACILLRALSFFVSHLLIRALVVIGAFAWAMIATTKFLGNLEPSRRALVLYPVGLYYLSVSWLIINDA
eukprot:m.12546 g.12546  ORF g.12546 m.12546 type:complete len:226 (+) comp4667_c0_seq2:253-930(+)